MDRNQNGTSFMALLLLGFISMAARDSSASMLSQFRKLGSDHDTPSKQNFPAPAPAPGPPSYHLSIGNCTSSLETCNDKSHLNITACLISSSNADKELYLLVQNRGESFIEVNVTTGLITQIIPIPKHGIKKVDFTGGNTSRIALKSGTNEECVIHFESTDPGKKSLFSHFHYNSSGYATPLNGAYFLAMTALISGGVWACVLLGKKESRADGIVPYRELEMGHTESESPSGVNVETNGRWDDQGWDDEWGEIKARQNGDESIINGLDCSKSEADGDSRDGWENTWDD